MICGRADEITLLTIGPLTNITLWFAIDPQIPNEAMQLRPSIQVDASVPPHWTGRESPGFNIKCNCLLKQEGYMGGFERLMRFPIAKLLDYEAHWSLLEASANPFAVIVMAHLKALATVMKPMTRTDIRNWSII